MATRSALTETDLQGWNQLGLLARKIKMLNIPGLVAHQCWSDGGALLRIITASGVRAALRHSARGWAWDTIPASVDPAWLQAALAIHTALGEL